MTTENILMNSMGFNNYVKQTEASVERYDNYEDSIYKEYVEAQENLTFIDTFEAINKHNAQSKLKMLNKINKAYGSCNRGIENYCRIQSLEAEEATVEKTEDKEETKNENKPAQPGTEKKLKWYQTVWEAIKKFFGRIRDFFKMIWSKITGLFKKNENVHNEIEQAAQEEPEKVKSLSEYLATAEVADDKDWKAVIINENVFKTLHKSGDDFVKLATKYEECVNKLIGGGLKETDMRPAEEFIKVIGAAYKIDNYDVGDARDKDSAAVMESRIKTVAEQFAYNEKTAQKWTNEIAGTRVIEKTSFKNIVGTTNAIEVNKMFKTYGPRMENLNKIFNRAFDMIDKTTKKYDNFVNSGVNSKNEIEQIKAYKIMSTCTMTFRVVTNLSNTYMKVIQMVTNTVGKLENNFIQNAKKFVIQGLKDLKDDAITTGKNIKKGAQNAYNEHKENKKRKQFQKSNMADANKDVDWNA